MTSSSLFDRTSTGGRAPHQAAQGGDYHKTVKKALKALAYNALGANLYKNEQLKEVRQAIQGIPGLGFLRRRGERNASPKDGSSFTCRGAAEWRRYACGAAVNEARLARRSARRARFGCGVRQSMSGSMRSR